MSVLKNKKIIVGTTGSIAAYKTPFLVRELVKEGASVNVVMTPSATRFVTPLVLENLSKNPVALEMFQDSLQSGGAWHIQLAHWCDLMIIAPCSATTMGKLAHGICDTALGAVAAALPRNIPLLIAPAMDSTMWLHPAAQRNVKTLAGDGAIIIPPAEGELASGLTGPGRLPEIEVLLKYIRDAFIYISNAAHPDTAGYKKVYSEPEIEHAAANGAEVIIEKKIQAKTYEQSLKEAMDKPSQPLEDAVEKDKWAAELEFSKMKSIVNGVEDKYKVFVGKKFLISAGPTLEKIDDVRYISNFSSGKMGYALAKAAAEAGGSVTLVSGPAAMPAPAGAVLISVESAKEMYDAVTAEFQNSDISIMAAAVADYRPSTVYDGKIKKSVTGENMTIELESTDDILAELGRRKNDAQKIVGFALESENEIENGWKKLQAKNCDMIVVNSANKPQSGFQGDDNTISILTREGLKKDFGPAGKDFCAAAILDRLAEII